MTRTEYIDHIRALYRAANNSDNEFKPEWMNGDESATHCQPLDQIVRALDLGENWLEGDDRTNAEIDVEMYGVTIVDGDFVRLEAWDYSTATIGIDWDADDDHPYGFRPFAMYAGAMLADDGGAHNREMKARNAAAHVLTDGQEVRIAGYQFTVKVMRGNAGRFPVNSDPIHFIPA